MLTNLGNFIQMLLILTTNLIFYFIRKTCKNIKKAEAIVIFFSIS